MAIEPLEAETSLRLHEGSMDADSLYDAILKSTGDVRLAERRRADRIIEQMRKRSAE